MGKHAIVLLVLVLACSKGEQTKPKGPECGPAVEALVKTLPLKDAQADEKRSNAKALIGNRCAEDKWNDTARACMIGAATGEAQRDCFYKNLTQEQQDKLDRALRPFLGSDERARAEDVMATMEGFKDQMCACKDAKCAERVSDDMTKWSQQAARDMKDPPRLTDEDTRRASDIGEAMGRCMQAAMSAQTAAGSNRDEIFAALERFKEAMCACKDAKCAERVSDDKISWSRTTAGKLGYPAKLTSDERTRADGIDGAIRKCEEAAFDAVPPRKK
jgi:hypothetical protein